MEVGFSKTFLFQLNSHPKPKQMFNKDYPFTGSSKGDKHFHSYANWIKKNYGKVKKILEIGSNDGTFLENFRKTYWGDGNRTI